MRTGAWMRTGLTTLVLWPVLALAAPLGLVTIVEGEASVLRDTLRFNAEEGMRLRADDILRTAATARFVRIELDGGQTLDLGPATQLLLQPAASGAGRTIDFYLAQGWVKFGSGAKAPTKPTTLAAPRLDATRIAGTVVLHADKDGDWLFVESGAADAVQHREGTGAATQALKEGDAFVLRGGELGSVSRRLGAEALAQMPKMFTDTLPLRAARYAGKAVEPARSQDLDYRDVAAFVNGEAAVRTGFVARLTPLAEKEPRFRSALLADIKLHPEWQRVLNPPPPPPRPKPVVVLARQAVSAPNAVPTSTWTERRELIGPAEPETNTAATEPPTDAPVSLHDLIH